MGAGFSGQNLRIKYFPWTSAMGMATRPHAFGALQQMLNLTENFSILIYAPRQMFFVFVFVFCFFLCHGFGTVVYGMQFIKLQ